jgi:hypothetical protein
MCVPQSGSPKSSQSSRWFGRATSSIVTADVDVPKVLEKRIHLAEVQRRREENKAISVAVTKKEPKRGKETGDKARAAGRSVRRRYGKAPLGCWDNAAAAAAATAACA